MIKIDGYTGREIPEETKSSNKTRSAEFFGFGEKKAWTYAHAAMCYDRARDNDPGMYDAKFREIVSYSKQVKTKLVPVFVKFLRGHFIPAPLDAAEIKQIGMDLDRKIARCIHNPDLQPVFQSEILVLEGRPIIVKVPGAASDDFASFYDHTRPQYESISPNNDLAWVQVGGNREHTFIGIDIVISLEAVVKHYHPKVLTLFKASKGRL